MLKQCKNHPEAAYEACFRHLFTAFRFGLRLRGAGLAAMFHGLCPARFRETGSSMVFKVNAGRRPRIFPAMIPAMNEVQKGHG